jgi:hypothetical protein
LKEDPGPLGFESASFCSKITLHRQYTSFIRLTSQCSLAHLTGIQDRLRTVAFCSNAFTDQKFNFTKTPDMCPLAYKPLHPESHLLLVHAPALVRLLPQEPPTFPHPGSIVLSVNDLRLLLEFDVDRGGARLHRFGGPPLAHLPEGECLGDPPADGPLPLCTTPPSSLGALFRTKFPFRTSPSQYHPIPCNDKSNMGQGKHFSKHDRATRTPPIPPCALKGML